MKILLALVVVAATATVAASAFGAAKGARVAVRSASPVTISGAGFKPDERVTLTVSADATRTKKLTAGVHGGFRTTFRGLFIDRCVSYVVRATGNRGSSALLKALPECPPA